MASKRKRKEKAAPKPVKPIKPVKGVGGDVVAADGVVDTRFVSRGGHKLQAVVDQVTLATDGAVCADLGCSVGGFTDCLLQAGAAKVHAVDTAYGQLAWKLRQDDRVAVHERTNAMHLDPPEPCRLVVIDLGWTKQDKAIPVALKWLDANDADARIISLIKPHYESGEHRLEDARARAICHEVAEQLPTLGVVVEALIEPDIRGGKGSNLEMLAVLRRVGEGGVLQSDGGVADGPVSDAAEASDK